MNNYNGSPGIPTKLFGVRFRSKLEAQWAAMFESMGMEWTYEPFEGRGYIPDFLLNGNMPLMVEIKPGINMPELIRHIPKVTRGLRYWEHDIAILGGVENVRHGEYHSGMCAGTCDFQHPGIMLEYCPEPGERNPWARGEATWSECATCGRPGIVHTLMSFAVRPCGHHNGGHIDSLPGVTDKWRAAANKVQWFADTGEAADY